MPSRVLSSSRSCVLILATAATAVALAASPARAAARGWPLDGPGRTVLAFGAHYAEAGSVHTHTGADLAASTGERVVAPVAGHVTFVGQVPSGTTGRVLALTLETAAGDAVTLMPLVEASVSRGDEVEAGEQLATVASEGDRSSADTHLHVSVRVGSLYVDPLSRFAAPVEAVPTPEPAGPAPQPHPVAPEPAPAAPVTAPASRPAPAAQAAAPAPQPGTSVTTVGQAVQAPSVAGHVATAVGVGTSAAAIGGPVASTASRIRPVTHGPVTAYRSRDRTASSTGFSWQALVSALQTRNRLVTTVVSYLLASIAASGLIATASRARPKETALLAPSPARDRG